MSEDPRQDRRPGLLRPSDGRSATPLLYRPGQDEEAQDRGRGRDDRNRGGYGGGHFNSGHPTLRPSPPHATTTTTTTSLPTTPVTPRTAAAMPTFSRRSTLRSRSPPSDAARLAARRRYTYASIFLVVSLVSFTAQTELAAWVQNEGWAKPYCMLYLTHGSWVVLWPAQLLVLRLQKRDVPWPVFWRRHYWLVRSTAVMVHRRDLDLPRGYGDHAYGPWRYMMRTTAGITSALTIAGLSWYVAVNMTTPGDLTAIYNCSAFFAYAFSVPLLGERLRLDKSLAVAIAIGGVLVVAYGDGGSGHGGGGEGGRRFMGNVVIGVGSVLYGLYEVLYKRFACPPDGCSPGRGMIFANTFGSLVGLFTTLVLWLPLPLLHWTGIETFELPGLRVGSMLMLSVVMNASFSGSFLVLISLTSPVLSSVASLLTIFIVALADWFIKREPLGSAALGGGLMIVVAFVMLSWSTYREMAEEEERKVKAADAQSSGSDDDDDDDGLLSGNDDDTGDARHDV